MRGLRASLNTRSLVRRLRHKDAGVRRAAAEALGQSGASAAEPLMTALRDPIADVRAAAAAALGRVRDARAVAPLAEALRDADPDVRVAAGAALGSFRDAPAVAALIAALRDEHPAVCAAVSRSLQDMGVLAVPPLVAALADPVQRVRLEAAGILGRIGNPQSIPALAGLLHAEGEVGAAAATALGRCGAPAVGALIAQLRGGPPETRPHAGRALAMIGAPAAGALAVVVRDATVDNAVRAAAAEALSRTGAPLTAPVEAWCAVVLRDWARAVSLGDVAMEPLGEALKDPDAAVRRAAADAVAAIGLPGDLAVRAWHALALRDWDGAAALGRVAIGPLLEGMNDQDPEARQGAAAALGRVAAVLDDPLEAALRARVIEVLVSALGDPLSGVRRAAGRSLGKMGTAAVDPLAAILSDARRPPRTRVAAALALGCTGCERAVAPLLAALRDGRWSVRVAAADGLGSIGALALKSLGTALNNERWYVRWGAVRALGRSGAEAGAGLLRAALQDREKYVRWAAADGLERIGVPDDPAAAAWYAVVRRDWRRAVACGDMALGPLMAALREDDAAVRAAAATALAEIGAPAVELLLAALEDEAPAVRASTAAALGLSGDAGAVEPLLQALGDREPAVRAAAAEALGRLCDERAVPALLAATHDAAREPRRAAVAALSRFVKPTGDSPDELPLELPPEETDERWIVPRALALGDDHQIVGALRVALKDGRAAVRRAAAEACPLLGSPLALRGLAAILDDPDPGVREAVAEALGHGGDYAIEPLMIALEDEQPGVRAAAAEALDHAGAGVTNYPLLAWASGPLAGVLRDDDSPRARRAAASALGRIGAPAVELLAAALEDEDEGVRQAAAAALDRAGLPADPAAHAWFAVSRGDWEHLPALGGSAVDALLASLHDRELLLQHAAAEALAAMGPAAAEPLLAALAHGSPVAAEALGHMGEKRALEPLLGALASTQWGPGLRRAAAEALGCLGDPAARMPLLLALHDDVWPVRVAAVAALDALGWQPDDSTAAAIYWAVKGRWDACVALGPVAAEPLIAALEQGDARAAAAEALGAIGARPLPLELRARVVQALSAALDGHQRDVGRAAASALANLYGQG